MIFIGIIFLASSGIFAQKILIVENQKSFKNYKYYIGETITLRIPDEEERIHDVITDLTQKSIVLMDFGEVGIDDVTALYRDNWFVKVMKPFTLIAGVAYFGLDSFNRLINNDAPVILVETAAISAGLVGLSFALTPFQQRKINTAEKWEMRVIDLGDF